MNAMQFKQVLRHELIYSPRPIGGSGLFTLVNMSNFRMNMLTSILARVVTQSQGDRGNPRSPEEPEEPGGRRQTGGPGNRSVTTAAVSTVERTCNSNVYMRECRTGMPYSYIFNSPLEEAACLCSIN